METAESHEFTVIGGPGRAISGTHTKDPNRFLSDEEAAETLGWIESGVPRAEVARRLGVAQSRVFDRSCELRGKGTLAHPSFATRPNRRGKGGGRPRGPLAAADDRGPSEQEIAEACQWIQATWSLEVEYQRRHGHLPDRAPVSVPRAVMLGRV